MLETCFLGLELKNPTVLASGILGMSAPIMKRVLDSGCGMATLKSFGPKEREGNPNPTIFTWEHGMINAVGLSNKGYKNMDDEWEELEKLEARPLMASFFGGNKEEFQEIAKFVAEKKPDVMELNISCPNVEKGTAFGVDKDAAYEVVKAVKNVSKDIPVVVKMTPQASNIQEIARACEKAGADGISAINTVPGMFIDIKSGKPILGFKKGGLTGPSIKPVAVKAVYDIYEEVKIPIISYGGTTTGEDAIEMVMAGATLTGIGTAVYYRGIDVFEKVCREMELFLKENNYKSLDEARGIAHE